MPITQLWSLSVIPSHLEEIVLAEFNAALDSVKTEFFNNKNKQKAFRNWCRDPDAFLLKVEIYDIQRRHKSISPSDIWSWRIYKSLFSIDEFDKLFYKYRRAGTDYPHIFTEQPSIFPVVTYGDTAVIILYYALGPDKAKQLPGFFGNFFIQAQQVSAELERISQIFTESDRNEMIKRGERWTYGYNDSVDEVINALPKALQIAKEQQCGLLGIQITVG